MHGMWNIQLNSMEAKGRENFDTNLSEQSVRIIPVKQTVDINLISDCMLVLLIHHLWCGSTSSFLLLFCFLFIHLSRTEISLGVTWYNSHLKLVPGRSN